MKQKPMFAALLAGAISITTLGACGSGTPDQIEALSLRDINQPLAGAWVVLSGLPTTLAPREGSGQVAAENYCQGLCYAASVVYRRIVACVGGGQRSWAEC